MYHGRHPNVAAWEQWPAVPIADQFLGPEDYPAGNFVHPLITLSEQAKDILEASLMPLVRRTAQQQEVSGLGALALQ